ncbi:hypothetical protein [Haloprofundus halobius]|nr:hypothetical protein [Haloprofundus halobius]
MLTDDAETRAVVEATVVRWALDDLGVAPRDGCRLSSRRTVEPSV